MATWRITGPRAVESVVVKRSRGWLSLVYALAALLAPALHDHDGRRGEAADAAGVVGCDDAGVHFAGHGGPDLSHQPEVCPACQFIDAHGPLALGTTAFVPPAAAPALGVAAVVTPSRPVSRPTGRSPPRV